MSAQQEFEQLVSDIDYPLFIVTTAVDGERSGCVVGFATQCSIDPPRFLVGLSETNHTFDVARRATHLAVHVIGRGDVDLAALFGGQTGDEVDKFAAIAWHEGPHGMPLIDALPAWFVGEIMERVPLGDHVGHMLHPVAAHAAAVDNLQFGDAKHIDPGHDP